MNNRNDIDDARIVMLGIVKDNPDHNLAWKLICEYITSLENIAHSYELIVDQMRDNVKKSDKYLESINTPFAERMINNARSRISVLISEISSIEHRISTGSYKLMRIGKETRRETEEDARRAIGAMKDEIAKHEELIKNHEAP